MSADAIFVLIVAGAAVVLFVTEVLAPDLIALLVLISLGVGGILDVPELFDGFSNPVIITLVGIFMLTSALHHTGVTAYVSQMLMRLTQNFQARELVGLLTAAAAIGSLMMNTVASVALMAPIGRRTALKRDISPSRVLMPIAFGALLGGMATLLTSSNLIVAGLLADRDLQPFGLLDFLPVGGPIALFGLVYLALVSQKMLPERSPSDQWSGLRAARKNLTETYRLAMRLHEAYVNPSSPLTTMTLAESKLGSEYGVTVSAVVRGRRTFSAPGPDMRIQGGDWLLMQGRPTQTAEAARELHLDLYDPDGDTQAVLFRSDSEIAEVALSPHTGAVGLTLGELQLRERYGINVLGIWHEGQPIRSFLSEHPLSSGDALLVQGLPAGLLQLSRDPDFLVLTQLPEIPENSDRALIAVAILVLFLITVAFDILPTSLAALLGAAAVVVTGCETMEQARNSIRWQVLFLIGGMLPLAAALEQTGATSAMVAGLGNVINSTGPRGLMMLFFLLTAGLAQFTSGQAAALIIGPLALTSGLDFGINPHTLLIAVAIGASTGFLSPVSHPANLLVMGPGGYKFSDYAKLGFPLVILSALGVFVFAPLAYPF